MNKDLIENIKENFDVDLLKKMPNLAFICLVEDLMNVTLGPIRKV